jgi:hypothetical protein
VSACQALAQQVAEGMLQANQIIQQHVQRHWSYTCTPNEFVAIIVNVLLLLKMSFLEPLLLVYLSEHIDPKTTKNPIFYYP